MGKSRNGGSGGLCRSDRSASVWLSVVVPIKDEPSFASSFMPAFESAIASCSRRVELVVVGAAPADLVGLGAGRDRTFLVEPPETRTIGQARNFGASRANGVLMFHTDADVSIVDAPSFWNRIAVVFSNPTVGAVTGIIMPRSDVSVSIRDRLFHRLGNAVIRASNTTRVHLARNELIVVHTDAFESVGGYDGRIVVGEDWDLFRRLARHGSRVMFDHQIAVAHSVRRFRESGYVRTALVYLREGVWLTVRGRSYLRSWDRVG